MPKSTDSLLKKKCKKCGGVGYKQLSYLHPKIECNMCGGTGNENEKV